MSTLVHTTTQAFNVPCRRFAASLTVSKTERLPLVKEFALRLIYVYRECDVSQLNAFFGFTERELAILIKDLCDAGLLSFEDGLLALSEETRDKFCKSSDGLPHISTVETWMENFAIDFVSFSLLHWEIRPDGYRVFHDLESTDIEKVSQSREVAKEVLANSFYEYVEKYKPTVSEDERSNMSIYGIAAVEPRDTFSFPLRVDFSVEPGNPSQCIHNYPDFKSEADQERRERIVQGVARKLQEVNEKSEFSGSCHKVFGKTLEDPYYSKFFSGEKLLIADLLSQCVTSEEIYYDERATRASVGGFTQDENREEFLAFLDESIDLSFGADGKFEPSVYWSKPTNDFWMRDGDTVAFASEIARRIASHVRQKPDLKLIVNNRLEQHRFLDKRLRLGNNHRIFAKAYGVNFSPEMATSEVLIVPGCVAALNFYYWEDGYDLPVPIGFITRDRGRLQILTTWALKEWSGYRRKVSELWCSKRNSKRVDPIDIQPRTAFLDLSRSIQKRSPTGGSTLTLQKK